MNNDKWTEIQKITSSDQFQINYISAFLSFLESSDWTIRPEIDRITGRNYFFSSETGTGVIIEKSVSMGDGKEFKIVIDSCISHEYTYVATMLSGKIYANIEIPYPTISLVSEKASEETKVWNAMRKLKLRAGDKLASFRLWKLQDISEENIEQHFTNFCKNAELEFQRRLSLLHI